MVIKLKNPRWDGWAVFRTWQAAAEVITQLLEDTWDEQERYTGSSLADIPLGDTYEVETDYMTEAEVAALPPLDY